MGVRKLLVGEDNSLAERIRRRRWSLILQHASPCSFLPRSAWCGYFAVADGRGRAHA